MSANNVKTPEQATLQAFKITALCGLAFVGLVAAAQHWVMSPAGLVLLPDGRFATLAEKTSANVGALAALSLVSLPIGACALLFVWERVLADFNNVIPNFSERATNYLNMSWLLAIVGGLGNGDRLIWSETFAHHAYWVLGSPVGLVGGLITFVAGFCIGLALTGCAVTVVALLSLLFWENRPSASAR